jgi:alkylhydroperoxidase family enzyme
MNWFAFLARRRMAAFEKKFGYDMSYGREMLSASARAFWRFSQVAALSAHREDVPLAAWYAAKLAGAQSEDCGPCTQLAVDMARHDGVPDALLRALLAGDVAALDDDTALAWRYARAAVAHSPELAELHDAVRARFGPRGLVSLAFAVTFSRMYPMLKYALGHGQACTRVRVGAQTVSPSADLRPQHAH